MNYAILREEELGSCDRIPFHTEIIDQEDQNSRKQSPDPTVVVRRDDITPTSSAKTRRKTQRGNTRPRRGRVTRGGLGYYHAPGDKRNIAEVLNLNNKPNCDPHVSRHRGNTMDTNGRIRQSQQTDAEMYENCQTKNRKIWKGPGIEISTVNSLNLNANLKHPHGAASMNSSN